MWSFCPVFDTYEGNCYNYWEKEWENKEPEITRVLTIFSKNEPGGKECPSELTEIKSCKMKKCTMPVDCVSETSEWTGECPACEEIDAKPTYQYKETKIKVMHAGTGIKCPTQLHQRKKCDIP